jgi:electron transfer flavoprotein beta subunit
MNILVVLRLVPDTGEEFELTADGKDIDREWIGFKLNEFDDHALEEAVLLKEAVGAKVMAVAFDGEGVDKLLQTALARGVDTVAKLTRDGTSALQAREAAALLSSLIPEHSIDLVLTGVQTPEDLFGQLAPALGATLEWPQVSGVSGIRSDVSGIVVQQEYSGGYAAALSLVLPAVVGVQSASKPPRYVSGTKLREVSSTKVTSMACAKTATPSPSELLSLNIPVSAGHAEMISGDANTVAKRMVAILRERGFLKG